MENIKYRGYNISMQANGNYYCPELTIYKPAYRYSDNLRAMKKMIRRQIAEAKFDKLRAIGITLCDVWGGRMWHNSLTGAYSWDVSGLAGRGFKDLNEFCFSFA